MLRLSECVSAGYIVSTHLRTVDLVAGKTKLSWLAADITYGRTATEEGMEFRDQGYDHNASLI